MSATFAIHDEHPRFYIAVSKADDSIRRWCCDNCGGHHWGRYSGGYWADGDYMDVDFDYLHPDGTHYECANGHRIDGPVRCMGECWPCRREREAVALPAGTEGGDGPAFNGPARGG